MIYKADLPRPTHSPPELFCSAQNHFVNSPLNPLWGVAAQFACSHCCDSCSYTMASKQSASTSTNDDRREGLRSLIASFIHDNKPEVTEFIKQLLIEFIMTNESSFIDLAGHITDDDKLLAFVTWKLSTLSVEDHEEL